MKYIYVLFNVLMASYCLAQVNLSNGLTACYALDGNAIEPVSNLNGTLSAVTPTADRSGNLNSAYYFNGSTNSYIQLPNNPLIKPTVISGSCWVWLNDVSHSQELIFAHNGCGSYHEGYQLSYEYQSQDGAMGFQVVKADATCSYNGQVRLPSNFSPVAAQTWYQVGFYAGPDSLKLYVNGQLVASMANANALVYDSGANVYLGNTNLAFNFPLTGILDNVKFYNRKLTNGEMYLLYTQDPSCESKITSLAENTNTASWNVSPNPGNGNFTVELPDLNTGELQILNALSQVVYKVHFENEKRFDINLKEQANGLYYLKVITAKETFSGKWIKQ